MVGYVKLHADGLIHSLFPKGLLFVSLFGIIRVYPCCHGKGDTITLITIVSPYNEEWRIKHASNYRCREYQYCSGVISRR